MLRRDPSGSADWIGPGGTTYDHWGPVSRFFQRELENGNILRSLKKHVNGVKADRAVIDTIDLTPEQIERLKKLIAEELTEAERARIIDIRRSLGK